MDAKQLAEIVKEIDRITNRPTRDDLKSLRDMLIDLDKGLQGCRKPSGMDRCRQMVT